MPKLHAQIPSQAEIDAQYNAGAAVPDYHHWLEKWQVESLAARRARCDLGVSYGPTLPEKLDIFPAESPAAPVHVFFHGGYWRSLAAADFNFVAAPLRELGFTTVLVDYALCPTVGIAEIVRQARASISWVYRNIGGFGGDPERLTVSGHSAGGHLAMMSALTQWEMHYGLPADVVKAAISISGLHDLAPFRYSYLQPALQLDQETIEQCSPIRCVRNVCARILVTWGELESTEFGRQAIEFASALKLAGCSVDCSAIPNAHHFSVLDGFSDPRSELRNWLRHADR